MMGIGYYDRQGKKITRDEFARYAADMDYKRVGWTELPEKKLRDCVARHEPHLR